MQPPPQQPDYDAQASAPQHFAQQQEFFAVDEPATIVAGGFEGQQSDYAMQPPPPAPFFGMGSPPPAPVFYMGPPPQGPFFEMGPPGQPPFPQQQQEGDDSAPGGSRARTGAYEKIYKMLADDLTPEEMIAKGVTKKEIKGAKDAKRKKEKEKEQGGENQKKKRKRGSRQEQGDEKKSTANTGVTRQILTLQDDGWLPEAIIEQWKFTQKEIDEANKNLSVRLKRQAARGSEKPASVATTASAISGTSYDNVPDPSNPLPVPHYLIWDEPTTAGNPPELDDQQQRQSSRRRAPQEPTSRSRAPQESTSRRRAPREPRVTHQDAPEWVEGILLMESTPYRFYSYDTKRSHAIGGRPLSFDPGSSALLRHQLDDEWGANLAYGNPAFYNKKARHDPIRYMNDFECHTWDNGEIRLERDESNNIIVTPKGASTQSQEQMLPAATSALSLAETPGGQGAPQSLSAYASDYDGGQNILVYPRTQPPGGEPYYQQDDPRYSPGGGGAATQSRRISRGASEGGISSPLKPRTPPKNGWIPRETSPSRGKGDRSRTR